MNTWELLGKFYELNGISWNSEEKFAVFGNKESAVAFKKAAPNWIVRWIARQY